MRIAVANNFYPPRVGGSSHLSDALARGYARSGHEVLVLTCAYADAPVEEHRDGLRIVRLPAYSIPQTRLSVSFDIAFTLRPALPGAVTRLLDDFRPDVIHQHGQFFDLTWATGLYARHRGVPALLSVHTRLENPKAHYRGIFRWLDALLVAPVLRTYRPRIVVMDVQMDEYIRSRYRGAYAGLDYIPVGVEPDAVRGGDAAVVRARHGLADAPLVLSLGHVIPLRDRVALVEALPAVLARAPATRLLVVGHLYYELFLQRARQLGVEDAVVTVGAVPKTEIRHYLAAAAVEAHDLQGYGLGTASLESMAAGVPVVAAVRPDNFPGVELLSGSNCVLVPVGEPAALAREIAWLLEDDEARTRIGAAGRRLVAEHFTMDGVLEKHLGVLGALAAGRRSVRR